MYTVAHLLRPVSGGILKHWQVLAQAARDFGFKVLVLSSENNDWKQLSLYADSVYPLPLSGRVHPFRDLLSVKKIREFTKEHSVDIVHFHGFKTSLVGTIALAKKSGPLVYTVHNYCPGGVGALGLAYPILERRVASSCQAVICVSHHLAQYLTSIPGYPVERLNIIPNGIEIAPFLKGLRDHLTLSRKIREDHQVPSDYLVALTVSRLIPAKGISTLINSAEQVWKAGEKVRFLIVGDGPNRKEFQEQADLLNLTIGEKIVSFTGQLENPLPLYIGSDLFILPSWSEGLPLSLLEAGAAGLPVVATEVGGIPEVIDHGSTGFLVEARNSNQLARAILKLIADKQRARALGERLHHFVQENYSVEKMMEKTYNLYLELLESRENR